MSFADKKTQIALLRSFYLCFYFVLTLFALMVFFGISNTPQLPLNWHLTNRDMLRAKHILYEGAKTKPDELALLTLTADDLNLAANYLVNRYRKSAVLIELKNQKIRCSVTITLPENHLGNYLNISFRLGHEQNNNLLSITKFKVGKLLIPARMANMLVHFIINHSFLNNYFILVTQPLEKLQIADNQIIISYKPNAQNLIHSQSLATQDDLNRLVIYQEKISQIVANHDKNWRLSLADLLKPIFALAFERSTHETAISENRIAIFAINNYVNFRENKKFLAISNNTPQPHYAVFLYKRIDLAKHFIASAALTASMNRQIAQVIGEEKELSDAKQGSGFSFVDLAADKAGTRFGELAINSPDSARKIQKMMSEIKDYRDFMPDPRDLPEKMTDSDFKNRFDFVGSQPYSELIKIIDQRIDSLPFYKKF